MGVFRPAGVSYLRILAPGPKQPVGDTAGNVVAARTLA